jgi:hypothetical protein
MGGVLKAPGLLAKDDAILNLFFFFQFKFFFSNEWLNEFIRTRHP